MNPLGCALHKTTTNPGRGQTEFHHETKDKMIDEDDSTKDAIKTFKS